MRESERESGEKTGVCSYVTHLGSGSQILSPLFVVLLSMRPVSKRLDAIFLFSYGFLSFFFFYVP